MPTTHDHQQHPAADEPAAEQFWEEFYRERDQVWTGRPNPLLVDEAGPLPAGTALDLGCGEGGDAIWLAERGWRVTAVDVSATALARLAARAAERGVAELIERERHDLAHSFPTGEFDLVSAQFFHSPVAPAGERDRVLRRAAGAVAPGGVLLVAGHASWPSWLDDDERPDIHFPGTGEVVAAMELDRDAWRVEREEVLVHDLPGPDGRPGTRRDNILRVRRLR